jgi:hypothetical protein
VLQAKGWLAMGGQIIDATVIAARRLRLTQAEKTTIKGGGTPAGWKPARRAQIDRDGRWTIKRGRKRETPSSASHKRQPEIAVPILQKSRRHRPQARLSAALHRDRRGSA